MMAIMRQLAIVVGFVFAEASGQVIVGARIVQELPTATTAVDVSGERGRVPIGGGS